MNETSTLLPSPFTFRKVQACFYFSSLFFFFVRLQFSLERLGIGSWSWSPSLIPADCLGLSAREQPQFHSTKAFSFPGLKMVFASVACLAPILHLENMLFPQPSLTPCLVPMASPPIPFRVPKSPPFALGSWYTGQVGSKMFVKSPY